MGGSNSAPLRACPVDGATLGLGGATHLLHISRTAAIDAEIERLRLVVNRELFPENLAMKPIGAAWIDGAASVFSAIHGLELSKESVPGEVKRLRAALTAAQAELSRLQR